MLAVAGEDYVVCAADTRMSTGYSVLTRDYKKIDQMSPKCVMASAGFMADAVTLKKTLKARSTTYEFQNGKPMGCVSFAQMLSNTLYYRRFFPYYTFNIVAGLDAEGKGAVFTYDAVGSYERTNYSCQGSGQSLIMPVLDNQLKTVSPLVLPQQSSATPLSEGEAVDLVKVGPDTARINVGVCGTKNKDILVYTQIIIPIHRKSTRAIQFRHVNLETDI